MAVVVSIARGHDASYPFETTGAAEGPVITGQCGVGYYLPAVEKRDEPAGTRRLGFELAHRPASREPYGTQHHAQAPPQERVVTHALTSHRRQRGSRRAGNSRMCKSAAMAVCCPARRGSSATKGAATRGRGWRLDGRSG